MYLTRPGNARNKADIYYVIKQKRRKYHEYTSSQEVKDCLDAHQRIGLQKPILPIWGSESDTQKPATKAELQDYLNNYPGSSIWRIPNKGERGEALNLKYSGFSAFELPTLTRYLRLGVEGEDVKALQRVLNAKGLM